MKSATSPSSAITTLNQQWYNAIAAGCGLDISQFQLYQGAGVLGITSDTVWAAFDSVPPLSTSNLFNPAQANSFSSDYGAMIFSLIAQGGARLQKDLGDFYMPFMTAWKAATSTDMVAFWQSWSSKNCPDLAAKGTSDILAMTNSPVTVAQIAWAAAQKAAKGDAYTTTITAVNTALTSGPTKTVSMNSSTQSSDVSRSWARSDTSGWFSIFGNGGSSQFDSLSTQFTSGTVVQNTTFSNLCTVAAGPLQQPNTTDPILSQYLPWFNSAVMGMAYATQDNTLWLPGVTPSWATTFGASGNMQRMCTALIIVDGVSSSITSSATFSASQFQQFQTASSGGIWPFYETNSSSGWQNNAVLNQDATITVTSTSPKGNPSILGVLVSPASALWASHVSRGDKTRA